jgi:hypothetical protein
MNWKQFLKPNWRKIVIFLLPIILTIITLFIEVKGSGWDILVYFPILICGIIPGCITSGGELPLVNNALYLLSFVITYIIWYPISCLIIWIYNKVKKKWNGKNF